MPRKKKTEQPPVDQAPIQPEKQPAEAAFAPTEAAEHGNPAVTDPEAKVVVQRTRKKAAAPKAKPAAAPAVQDGEIAPGDSTPVPEEKPPVRRTRKKTAAPKAQQSEPTEGEAVADPTPDAPPAEPEAVPEEASERPAAKRPRKRTVKQPDSGQEAPSSAEQEAAPQKQQEQPPVAEQEVPAEEPSNEKTPAENLPVPGHTAEIEASVPPIYFKGLLQERRNFWVRLLVLLLLGAVLFASVAVLIYRPSAYSEQTNSVRFLYRAAANDTQIAINGALLEGSYPGVCVETSYSATGNTVAALIGDTLYLIDGRKVTSLRAGVVDFLLSQNGKAVAYRTADNQLYYAVIGREVETSLISPDSRDANYCLSPDGKEFFYTYIRDESVYVDVYSRTNSKPRLKAFKGITPLAVGDGCDYLYYRDEQGNLFYMEQGSDTPFKLFSAELGAYALSFNRDFDEVLIDSEAGTQLWRRGERVVMPDLKTAERLTLLSNQRVATRELVSGKQYLQNSFLKNYYLKKGNDEGEGGLILMYLNRKGGLAVVSFVDAQKSAPVVTDKGVYFLVVEKKAEGEEMKHLYRCPAGKSEAERLSWDVQEFCPNTDGSRLLYTDQHGALYAMKLESVPVRLSDTVNAGSIRVTLDDAFYYYIGETLYTSDNGDTPRVLWESAAPATATDGHTAYFLQLDADGTFSVYTNHRNRRHQELVATGISAIS